MHDHVASHLPFEACGLLGGNGPRIRLALPVVNLTLSPHRFRMDPEDLIRGLYRLEDEELDLIGIYHSHPHGPPRPSLADLEEMANLVSLHLIWHRSAGRWTCRGFRFDANVPVQIPIEEVD